MIKEILLETIKVAWLFVPALLANTGAIISTKLLPKSDFPVDFYRTFRGRRIFGAHKTWRGLICGILMSMIVFSAQKVIFKETPFFKDLSLIDYEKTSLLFGFLSGFGSLLGDIVKSFFKRQYDIAPGKPWLPFDQIDWLIGSVLFIYPFLNLSWEIIFGVLSFGFFYCVITLYFYKNKIQLLGNFLGKAVC